MAGAHSQLLTALTAKVQTLNLQLNGATVPIVNRKKLGDEDGFAGLPVLVICPHGRERREYAFAGPVYWVWYDCLVALIVPGNLNLDGSLTGEMGTILDWRVSLAGPLADPSAIGLPFVANVDVDYSPVLDEHQIEAGMDISALVFSFQTLEGSFAP